MFHTAPVPSTEPRELLTCQEVAQRFRRSEYTIRDWTRDGRLKAINRPGRGRLLYRADDIDALMREMSS